MNRRAGHGVPNFVEEAVLQSPQTSRVRRAVYITENTVRDPEVRKAESRHASRIQRPDARGARTPQKHLRVVLGEARDALDQLGLSYRNYDAIPRRPREEFRLNPSRALHQRVRMNLPTDPEPRDARIQGHRERRSALGGNPLIVDRPPPTVSEDAEGIVTNQVDASTKFPRGTLVRSGGPTR